VTLRVIDSAGADLPVLTIPPGSFPAHRGTYEFSGPVDSVALNVQLQQADRGHYTFHVAGGGAPLADSGAGANVIAVTLMIGDDLGTTTATWPSNPRR
jgi:hypothetical protein